MENGDHIVRVGAIRRVCQYDAQLPAAARKSDVAGTGRMAERCASLKEVREGSV
jgi:hypothetical protein